MRAFPPCEGRPRSALRMAPRSAEGTEAGRDGGRRGERIGTFRVIFTVVRAYPLPNSGEGGAMAFQDSAESLAEKLHLSRVPRPGLRRHRPCPGARGRARRFRLRDVARQRLRGDGGERRDGGAVGGRCWRGGGESRWGGRRQRHLAAPPAADGEDVVLPAGGDATARRVLHPCGRLRGGAGRLLFGGGAVAS